jgi:hypothetical protein
MTDLARGPAPTWPGRSEFAGSPTFPLGTLRAIAQRLGQARTRISPAPAARHGPSSHRAHSPRDVHGARARHVRRASPEVRSVNLNVHLHVVVVDGVFTREAGELSFTAASPPTRVEMLALLQSVRRKLEKLSNDDVVVQAPLGACANVALSRGEVRAMTVDLEPSDEPIEPTAHDGAAVDDAGYNLEASVRLPAEDDFGREHLLRYCARPPLSLARLIELPRGKIGYRIKQLRNHRNKLRVMTPLELLARLAALVPPPRHPLVRYHGAFAPRSSWRRDVVPKLPAPKSEKPHAHVSKPTPPQSPPRAAVAPLRTGPTGLVARTEPLTPNVLAVHHWERLDSGALVATTPRVDWVLLMRRTFDVDVLDCPKCTGKLRILAVIDDRTVAAQILDALHIPRAHSPLRARDPTTLDSDRDLDDVC